MARRLLLGVLFGVLVYAGIVLWVDHEALESALREISWWCLPAAMGLSLCNYLLRFFKWERYRKLLEIDVPQSTSFLIYMSGFSMGITPGKMGEVLKSWMLKRVSGVRIHKSAPIVVAERFTDVTGYLILVAIGGIASHPEFAWVFWLTLVLCIATVLLVGSSRFERAVLAVLRRLPLLRRLASRAEGAFDSARTLLSVREVVPPTILSVFSWGFECLGFWLIANAFLPGDAEISLLFATFAYAISALVGAVAIFVPGGLGVTEWSLGALVRREYQELAGLGLEAARIQAVGAVLLIRFATLWFGVGVGLVALGLFQKRFGSVSLGDDEDEPSPPTVPSVSAEEASG